MQCKLVPPAPALAACLCCRPAWIRPAVMPCDHLTGNDVAAAMKGFCQAWYTQRADYCTQSVPVGTPLRAWPPRLLVLAWPAGEPPQPLPPPVKAGWVLLPQDAGWALHMVGCLPPCIRSCGPLLTFRRGLQQSQLVQQLVFFCGQQRNGSFQMVEHSNIQLVLQELPFLVLPQCLQALPDCLQLLLEP